MRFTGGWRQAVGERLGDLLGCIGVVSSMLYVHKTLLIAQLALTQYLLSGVMEPTTFMITTMLFCWKSEDHLGPQWLKTAAYLCWITAKLYLTKTLTVAFCVPFVITAAFTLALMTRFAKNMFKNFRSPSHSVIGYASAQYLKTSNIMMQTKAVRASDIQPDDTVLELGFGPGEGLALTLPLLSDGGKLYGLDHSQTVVNLAEQRFSDHVKQGRLRLTQASVYDMPYPSNTFDVIYHSNVYFFFEDGRRACAELLRVLKPGGRMVMSTCKMATDRLMNSVEELKLPFDGYVQCLRDVGFMDVRVEELPNICMGQYQTVYSYKRRD